MSELEITDWRRHVAELYSVVRAESDAATAHAIWRAGRDELFRCHPQSPLALEDPLRRNGLPYWPYDAALRFELPVRPAAEPLHLSLSTGADGTTSLRRIGRVDLPSPLNATIDVWWLDQYGGGLFLPLRDGSAGDASYGGGRSTSSTPQRALIWAAPVGR